MSTAPDVEPMEPLDDETILRVHTGADHEPVAAQRFVLDDDEHVLTAIRPKMHLMSKLGRALYYAREATATDDATAAIAAMETIDLFVGKCLDEPSRAYVLARLDDEEDYLDTEHVLNAITQLIGLWNPDRPTTPPSASSAPPRSAGRRSTVRRRSQAQTRMR